MPLSIAGWAALLVVSFCANVLRLFIILCPNGERVLRHNLILRFSRAKIISSGIQIFKYLNSPELYDRK